LVRWEVYSAVSLGLVSLLKPVRADDVEFDQYDETQKKRRLIDMLLDVLIDQEGTGKIQDAAPTVSRDGPDRRAGIEFIETPRTDVESSRST
jgi:hypothetical protein